MLDPRVETRAERFVAVATWGIGRRVDDFFEAAKTRRSLILDWISELDSLRLRPTTRILETVDRYFWATAQADWTASLRAGGAPLLNIERSSRLRPKLRDDLKAAPGSAPRIMTSKRTSRSPVAKKTAEELLAEKIGLPIEKWCGGALKAPKTPSNKA